MQSISFKCHDIFSFVLARAIGCNIYVDNLQGTHEDERELIEFYKDSRTLMSKGGFNLRQWTTNSLSLRRLIEADENEAKLKKQNEVGVLGILWNTTLDSFSVPFRKLVLNEDEFPKRNILSKVARIYDPLGILAPVVINSRIFIQDLWKLNTTRIKILWIRF